MPEFEFRVLCSDGDAKCDLVKFTMHELDFKIKNSSKKLPYDHIGTIKLIDYNQALEKLKLVNSKVGNDIRNISIIEK